MVDHESQNDDFLRSRSRTTFFVLLGLAVVCRNVWSEHLMQYRVSSRHTVSRRSVWSLSVHGLTPVLHITNSPSRSDCDVKHTQ